MKHPALTLIIGGFALLLGFTAPVHARPQVMILGTFHFDNPAMDRINVGTDAVLGDERQAQIAAVVEGLAEFAPTHIAVELLPESVDRFNARYRAWRGGEAVLTANERDQLGIRLAARLDHERLYGVDYQSQGMDFQAMMAAGQAAGQTALLTRLQAAFADIERTLKTEQGPEKTIGEMLAFHNGPWVEAGNALYLKMAVLGETDHATGAQVVAEWYARNLHIYANIARLVDSDDARILVIYGSGHRDQLTDFFEENPDFELVSPLDFLPE